MQTTSWRSLAGTKGGQGKEWQRVAGEVVLEEPFWGVRWDSCKVCDLAAGTLHSLARGQDGDFAHIGICATLNTGDRVLLPR